MMNTAILSLSTLAILVLIPGSRQAPPGDSVIVGDGQVFSGTLTCTDFYVPHSVTAWVAGDFVLQATGEVAIHGTVKAVDRELGDELSDGPRITILAAERLFVAPGGALLGGKGKSYPDSPGPWLGLSGGEGSSVHIDATTFAILGEVRAGGGGAGARGGDGGRGGNLRIVGAPAPHPEESQDAGPGMVGSGAGGRGGNGILSGLHDLAAGDGGESGSVTFTSREKVAGSAPGSNLGPAHGGAASSSCPPGGAGVGGEPGTPTTQAPGAPGTAGTGNPAGAPGSHGGQGAKAYGVPGAQGGQGSNCCNN